MATALEELNTRNKTLNELWYEYFTQVNEQTNIFSASDVYSDETLYESVGNTDRVIVNIDNTQNTSRRKGLPRETAKKMSATITNNQRGVGLDVGAKKTIQLFNSSNPYPTNAQDLHQIQGNVERNVFNPINKELSEVRTRINFMLNQWINIAEEAVEGGVSIGYNNETGNMPGTNHRTNTYGGTNTPNNYKFGKSYREKFLKAVENTAQPADKNQLTKMASKGFNEGQILGGSKWKNPKQTWTMNSLLDRIDFSDVSAFIGSVADAVFGGDDRTETELEAARRKLEEIRGDIVKAYLPGYNRITQPFHSRTSLNNYLQQNVLLPPDVRRQNRISKRYRDKIGLEGGREERIEQPGRSDVPAQDNFRAMWVNNPVRPTGSLSRRDLWRELSDGTRFDKGIVSGVGVKDIERQGEPFRGRATPNTIFTHEEDGVFLHPDAKDRGFEHNIAVAVHGDSKGGLTPAVYSISGDLKTPTDKMGFHDEAGGDQFFQFLFTTENRDSGSSDAASTFQQVCYLQASISNLNESFSPQWSPKHFFGRTEQVQTYSFTDRNIDIGFVIYATDMRRLQNVWERVTWLAQQTYGQYRYSDDFASSRLLNGPLVRMSIGDLYKGVPGFIRSLSYDWNTLGAGGKWEMTKGIRMPMACSVSLSFSVIHDDNPHRNYNLYQGMTQGPVNMLQIGNPTTRLIPGRNDDLTAESFDVGSTYADLVDFHSSL